MQGEMVRMIDLNAAERTGSYPSCDSMADTTLFVSAQRSKRTPIAVEVDRYA